VDLTQQVASYWDANREKTKDPAFWMAHPRCRSAINRRVSGSEHEWPLDWFKRITVGGGRFGRGLSWGCGLGAFERSAIKAGLVERIDAFDVSSRSLEEARETAANEAIEGIQYQIGSFDDPILTPRLYDIVFFHASLHHVFALERLFRRLSFSLKPRGWIPDDAKLTTQVPLPIEPNDPSEGARSDEIPRFIREFFDVTEWKPYGGQVTDVVLPCVSRDWAASEEGSKFVQAMLDIEDWQLSALPSLNHHVVAFGRLKHPARLVRPLLRQTSQAVERRLSLLRARLLSG
jgi:SAM-dependent methyltransferase